MSHPGPKSPEDLARRRARYLTELVWHAGSFLIIGVFFAVLDLVGDGRLTWSLWVLGAWAVALAFHGLAYLVDGSNLRERKTRQYLDKARHPDSHTD